MQQAVPATDIGDTKDHSPVECPSRPEEVSTPGVHKSRRRTSFVDPRLGVGPKWGHIDDITTIAARPPHEAKACCVEVLTTATKRAIGSTKAKEVIFDLIDSLGLGELRECASSLEGFDDAARRVLTDAGLEDPIQWLQRGQDQQDIGSVPVTPSTALPPSVTGTTLCSVGSTAVPVPREDVVDACIKLPRDIRRFGSRKEFENATDIHQCEFINDIISFLIPAMVLDPTLSLRLLLLDSDPLTYLVSWTLFRMLIASRPTLTTPSNSWEWRKRFNFQYGTISSRTDIQLWQSACLVMVGVSPPRMMTRTLPPYLHC